jgi:hypothetical protein
MEHMALMIYSPTTSPKDRRNISSSQIGISPGSNRPKSQGENLRTFRPEMRVPYTVVASNKFDIGSSRMPTSVQISALSVCLGWSGA